MRTLWTGLFFAAGLWLVVGWQAAIGGFALGAAFGFVHSLVYRRVSRLKPTPAIIVAEKRQ
jgi:membrane associated rhomboid family serine protease